MRTLAAADHREIDPPIAVPLPEPPPVEAFPDMGMPGDFGGFDGFDGGGFDL